MGLEERRYRNECPREIHQTDDSDRFHHRAVGCRVAAVTLGDDVEGLWVLSVRVIEAR